MRNLVVIALGWLALCAFSAAAAAQSFAAGYARYQRGDCKGAERALTQALPLEPLADVRARTLKLLGICAYMRGDQAAAAASFRQALALAPGITIGADEVLDESVLDFFRQLRQRQQAAAPPAGAAPRKTTLRVTTDAPLATVLVNGVVVGSANAALDVDPGAAQLEVQAPGYAPRHQAVVLARARETAVTVNLSPSPKAEAKPAAPSDADAQAELAAASPPPTAKEKRKHARKPRGQPAASSALFDDGAADPARAAAFGDLADAAPPGGDGAAEGGSGAAESAGAAAAEPAEDPAASYGRAPKSLPPAAGAEGERGGGRSRVTGLLRLLPFGVGQAQNHQYVYGAVFFGGEAAAAYTWYTSYNAVNSAQSRGKALVASRAAANQELTPEDQAYLSATTSYERSQQQQALYGEAAFGLLWAAGVVQALLYTPPAAAKDRKHTRRRAGGLAPDRIDLMPAPGAPQLRLAWEL